MFALGERTLKEGQFKSLKMMAPTLFCKDFLRIFQFSFMT